MQEKIRVVVSGAYGRMGREVVRACLNEETVNLVGVADVKGKGQDIGPLVGGDRLGLQLESDLAVLLKSVQPEVMVDFTNPQAVARNAKTALEHGVRPVIGTTGLEEKDIEDLRRLADKQNLSAFIAPNFALGAVLMMRFARAAARFFPNAEIIEFHHDQKLDAPSGTAARTAKLIVEERGELRQGHPNEYEKIPGSRGGEMSGLRVHSVRLPGLVAHQEVIFGGIGQTLTIRHDSLSRESFMPGVIMAVKRVKELKGVVIGLDNLITA
jgi:4-hydroxy-tetrahydrodipicolinate reductase